MWVIIIFVAMRFHYTEPLKTSWQLQTCKNEDSKLLCLRYKKVWNFFCAAWFGNDCKCWRLRNMLDVCWAEVHFPWSPLGQMNVWCFRLPCTALIHLPECLLIVYLETVLLPCCLWYELFPLWLNWTRIIALLYFLCVFQKCRRSWWADYFLTDITFDYLFFTSYLEKTACASSSPT